MQKHNDFFTLLVLLYDRLQSMTALRTRRETKKYHKYLKEVTAKKGDVCEFCEMGPGHPQFVVQTQHFKVVRILFKYSLWDGHGVADHLMIIPKQHVDSLSGLGPETATEFLNLVAVYEKQGYNIYARAPQSKVRSIAHQHTHLIKSTNKSHRFLFFISKPYLRIAR